MKHEIEYRGEKLLNKLANTQIVVCGAGTLGSNLIDTLVRIGARKIKVIDFDRVEPANITNQVYDLTDVGKLKVAALKTKVYNITRHEILIENKKLDLSNVSKFLKGADLVVDCFDNTASRALLTKYCAESKTECLHAGMIDDYGEVIWNKDYKVPKDVKGDVCDYPLARNLSTIVVAVMAEQLLGFIKDGSKNNLCVSLSGMKIYDYK